MARTVRRLSANRWLMLATKPFGCGLAAAIPTITFLWGERGMTRGDFYLLEIFFALALLVLEVLTGRFADRYGKVLTLKLSFLSLGTGCLLYAYATSFTGFLWGEVFMALALALSSGTDEALLFQSNKNLEQSDQHQWWWSVYLGLGFVSMGCFSIVGAWLGSLNLIYPYLLATGCSVFALLICFFLYEPAVGAADEGGCSGEGLGHALHSVLFANPLVRWMAIAPGFVVAINQTYLWMYPEYLKDCHLTVIQSGFVFALFNMVAGGSALFLRNIDDGKTGMKIYFALLVTLMLSTIGLIGIVSLWAWVLLVPQQVIRSVSGALFSQTINAAIPDSVRATALSVRNALRVTLYVSVMVPWWLGIDALGRNGMFSVNLLMLGVGGFLFWLTVPAQKHV